MLTPEVHMGIAHMEDGAIGVNGATLKDVARRHQVKRFVQNYSDAPTCFGGSAGGTKASCPIIRAAIAGS